MNVVDSGAWECCELNEMIMPDGAENSRYNIQE